jgi:hypothetical protein
MTEYNAKPYKASFAVSLGATYFLFGAGIDK